MERTGRTTDHQRGLLRGRGRDALRSGFSLLEILVVISVFVLLLAIAVPAFNSILDSTTRSLAENQLKSGLSAGRDAAIQSERGDGAAVFFFQPGGRLSIVPCVQVGRMVDVRQGLRTLVDRLSSENQIERDVFVPVPGMKTVDLPSGWSVRGFIAPLRTSVRQAISVNPQPSVASQNGWYQSMWQRRVQGNWVFPETNFIKLWNADGTPITDPATIDRQGALRQTFMVRFKAGTGELDTSSRMPAIVVDPVDAPSYRDLKTIPGLGPGNISAGRLARPDQAASVFEWTRRVLAAPEAMINPSPSPGGITADVFRQYLIGTESIDSVLAGSVSELALYKEKAFVRAMASSEDYQAGPANTATGTYYTDPMDWPTSFPTTVAFDYPPIDSAFTLPSSKTNRDAVQDGFSLWALGRLKLKASPSARTDVKYAPSDAKVFVVQKLLGQAQEIRQ